ncbi:MAG: hypothetical protein UV80_C0008G0038 [Candidatus Peregrinibacteria bacterium GW2011_GWF2_43_17]|nr:MAG: hypothetical protein UV80_C0008G0038 [Candidatus Peregrinibacteria bacterium GW2011_GWF2_43_17]KKT18909.1 MAG: hypothetical protein UW03_C0028G0025 [Candidatus Peregrinibacteria bacterium GW2011_GWA2_43_8]HAU39503.1 hypothetical protein [Candidatus Peregrinibacteria bacterium]
MNTPREDQSTQNSDPILEELKQELSDADLQSRGLLFSAKYLLCRVIMANGYDFSKKIPFDDVRQRLNQLFPKQEGEWLPNYLQYHNDAFSIAFDWARDKAYEEWKVGKVASLLKKDRPDATDETLEIEARFKIERAKVFDELKAATIQATRDLGIID